MPQTSKSGPVMKPRRRLGARLAGGYNKETGGQGKGRSHTGNPTKGGRIAGKMRGQKIRGYKW